MSITVIILTCNESQHIERCIKSIVDVVDHVVVIDSYSTDDTVKIAKSLGAVVYKNEFVNQAVQLNWALDNCHIKSDWLLRLDADEVVTSELSCNIRAKLSKIDSDVSGLTINRRIHFLGRWIRRGGIYPIAPLRLWRNGKGRCENRWMDEHLLVEGKVQHFVGDISDINLNNLTWWTSKHNDYSSREAIEVLLAKERKLKADFSTGKQAKLKRWIKDNLYSKLPIGLRAFSYFIFRYFFMLGFLDGWQGFVFHVLQGFWYRFLVDAKTFELEQLMEKRKLSLADVARIEFGYDLRRDM